jgi:DNA-binding XRE family transcriptional regulator
LNIHADLRNANRENDQPQGALGDNPIMNISLPILAGRLRRLRQQCGKTQAAMAAEFRAANIPITRPMLANWESGPFHSQPSQMHSP